MVQKNIFKRDVREHRANYLAETGRPESYMNWINSVVRPKIRSFLNKRDSPENLWVKCPKSGEMVFYRDLEANQWVVPNSGFHMKIKARDRLKAFLDDGQFTEHEVPDVAHDPLKFRAIKKYSDQLRDYRAKTDMKDCVLLASGKLLGRDVTTAVQDFDFGGGSLGMAAGATIVKGLELAVKNKTPFILFTASGGARMQEGMLSLMQMPRTTVAVQRLREAGLPYIVVFTDPTTGGRNRFLRDAWRHPHLRTECFDWFCRSACD